jgi:hypothetical protein
MITLRLVILYQACWSCAVVANLHVQTQLDEATGERTCHIVVFL